MQDFTKIPNLQNKAINVEVDAKKAQFKLPSFFSSKGRIGRLRFIVYFCLLYLILVVPFGLSYYLVYAEFLARSRIGAFLILDLLLFIYLQHLLIHKRLQDANLPGWLGFLIVVPMINFGLLLVLFFMSGTKGANKYGEPPQAKYLKKIFAALLLVIALVFVLFSIYLVFISKFS